MSEANASIPDDDHRRWAFVEVVLIFLLFFVLAGGPPPDVNEAHYLAKAKHYWNPAWCPGDLFLRSADAHLVFYWSVGWLTLFLPLTAVAWLGRALTWMLLAWSWRRLSTALVPGRLHALLAAGLFTALLRWGHMAGEWVVGGVEAKGFAYVFTLLALESLVRGRWWLVWPLLGLASSFHVLVGGWSVVAAMFAWWLTGGRRPAWASILPSLLVGLLIALPGLVPALSLTWGAAADTVRANGIYVFERLDHHLVFHRLPAIHIVRHVALLAIWLAMARGVTAAARSRRLQVFVAGAVLIAVAGALIDLTTLFHRPLAAALLRYYWFRLSDVMLPLGVTFAAIELILGGARKHAVLAPWCLAGAVLIAALHVGEVVCGHWLDGRPGAVAQSMPRMGTSVAQARRRFLAWRAACRWIARNTPADAVFLTPKFQQTFKWYAGRGELVTWKDVPQDAQGIVQWWQRNEEIYPERVEQQGLVAHGEDRLGRLARNRDYGFRYVVIDRTVSARPLAFTRVYPSFRHRRSPDERPAYEVYRLPPPESVPRGDRDGTDQTRR